MTTSAQAVVRWRGQEALGHCPGFFGGQVADLGVDGAESAVLYVAQADAYEVVAEAGVDQPS